MGGGRPARRVALGERGLLGHFRRDAGRVDPGDHRAAPDRGASREEPRTAAGLGRRAGQDAGRQFRSGAGIDLRPELSRISTCSPRPSTRTARRRDRCAMFSRVIRRSPTRFLRSTAKFAKSPKVDNLVAPFTQATHDTILMKDANAILEPDDLAEHMRHLNADVGLVCAIPYGANSENLAAHVEASILNGPHARMLFWASALGHGFGVGKIMLFRRGDFLRAGGFDAISHTVGEDNAMAKALARIGLRTVFSHRPVRQELGRRTFGDVYQRQLRWSVIRRRRRLAVVPGGALLSGVSGAYRRGRRRSAGQADAIRGGGRDIVALVRAGDVAFLYEGLARIMGCSRNLSASGGGDAGGMAPRLDHQPRGVGERAFRRARRCYEGRAGDHAGRAACDTKKRIDAWFLTFCVSSSTPSPRPAD